VRTARRVNPCDRKVGGMTTSEEREEKRKHKRLRAKNMGFVKFLFGAGALVDISGGGLAFRYVQNSGDDWDPLKGSMKLDLFKSRPFRNLIGVECSIVYDTAVPSKKNPPDTYQVRRCGVEFTQLAERQYRELHSFIKDLTVQ
jgi:hypothetical protein